LKNKPDEKEETRRSRRKRRRRRTRGDPSMSHQTDGGGHGHVVSVLRLRGSRANK
jgi:hypothetical protein